MGARGVVGVVIGLLLSSPYIWAIVNAYLAGDLSPASTSPASGDIFLTSLPWKDIGWVQGVYYDLGALFNFNPSSPGSWHKFAAAGTLFNGILAFIVGIAAWTSIKSRIAALFSLLYLLVCVLIPSFKYDKTLSSLNVMLYNPWGITHGHTPGFASHWGVDYSQLLDLLPYILVNTAYLYCVLCALVTLVLWARA